jgi:hypothetical protein
MCRLLALSGHARGVDRCPLNGHLGAQGSQSLAHRNAALEQESADLVDHTCALANQPFAHAMQRLKIELACIAAMLLAPVRAQAHSRCIRVIKFSSYAPR